MSNADNPRLRSRAWFDTTVDPAETAIYVERFLNYGITLAELQSGRPVIGIAQIGSDIAPCNRIHLQTVERAVAGVRDAGGLPLVFPMHPLQESCRRPTAALDRNLAYLGLVEILHGYPFDGVILTTGCDKTTPAGLMAVSTLDLPAIVLSGGPMLDSYYGGQLAGSGTIVWEARRQLAVGKIGYTEFVEMVTASAPSAGHCNTMGTALTMNCLAEALGMSLPGCAAIPAPYRERLQIAYATGLRIVEMVHEDLVPSRIMTRAAFENAIVVNTALGGSTNAPWHLTAVARHLGLDLPLADWQTIGYEVPLLVNCQPSGQYLGEGFYRAGGVPAVMRELLDANRLQGDVLTVTGRTLSENIASARTLNRDVIRPYGEPLRPNAGFVVLSGNLCEAAIIKTSVISDDFRQRYLSRPGSENCFEVRAIVFDGPEDYHQRINDARLEIDEHCMLVIRGCGPVGYPGSAEVVNMQPPDRLIAAGITMLPTLGDGRQSGTSECPSILHVTPESAVGGNLALLQTGDRLRVDLGQCRVDLLVSDEELAQRQHNYQPAPLAHQTPWQELYRNCVGQLSTGACFDFATKYREVGKRIPRHSH